MPIKKSTATAFVNVRGLGIVCFNPNKNRSETAIIRDANHKLTINVYKPGFVDGANGDRVDLISILSKEITLRENASIEITTNSATEGLEFFRQGDFDRLSGDNDENDFRWLLNLEGSEMHNTALVKNKSCSINEKPPITKLYIENGLYYAVMPASDKEWETTPFFEKTDPIDKSKTDFGYIAETMGVNLVSDEVVLKINDGENEEIHSFKRVEGSPFKIEIWNVAINPDDNPMLSDLPTCYEFLHDVNGGRFDLTPKEENADGGKPVYGKNYCHVTIVDQETIDNFV